MNVGDWKYKADFACLNPETRDKDLYELRELIQADESLEMAEVAELLGYIASKSIVEDLQKNDEGGFLPRKYNVSKSFKLTDGLTKFGGSADESFVPWFLGKYLPSFHPMPNQTLQHKILTAWILINPVAVFDQNTPVPHAIFMGLRGSGKTLASNMARSFFGKYGKEFRISSTGASMRDELGNAYGRGDPGLAVWDNMNWAHSIPYLKQNYDLFIAWNQQQARTTIKVSAQEVKEFYTHCKKAFTTVYSLQTASIPEAQEILRRCFLFIFKEASPLETFYAYDWSSFVKVMGYFWSDTEKVEKSYFPILQNLYERSPKDYPFSGSELELVRVLIATSVYTGVFHNVDEAISQVKEHLDWSKGQDVGAVDAVTVLVSEFVEDHWRRECLADANPYFTVGVKSMQEIPCKEVYDYIIAQRGKGVNSSEDKQLVNLMASYGYTIKKMNDGLYFVKG